MSKTISRVRGDNYPIEAALKINREDVDLNGHTLTLSFVRIDDETNTVTSIVGVKNTNIKGRVAFYPTTEQMSPAGQYRFDIQGDNAGVITTYSSGNMILSDDVTA